MALLAVLTLSQAPLVLGDNPTVDNDIKFGLGAHGTKVSFSENMVTDSITLASENIMLDNLRLASSSYTTSSLILTVENADMTINAIENENIEFDLVASTGVESLAMVTDGERGEPESVKLNGAPLSEKANLAALYAASEGWYYENSTIYVKTTHASTNNVFVDWVAAAVTPPSSSIPSEVEPIYTMLYAAIALMAVALVVIPAVCLLAIVRSGGEGVDPSVVNSLIVIIVALVAAIIVMGSFLVII